MYVPTYTDTRQSLSYTHYKTYYVMKRDASIFPFAVFTSEAITKTSILKRLALDKMRLREWNTAEGYLHIRTYLLMQLSSVCVCVCE